MKQLFLTIIICASAMVTASSIVPAAAMAQGAPMQGNPGGGQPEQFDQRKAHILQRIGDRIAEMQKRQACVQAAANPEALRACMPEREGRGEEGGEHR